MDEDDEVPSLLLQAWSERLSYLADFCAAALSPSQDTLLLLSREGNVVVLPLRTGSEGLIPNAHLPVLRNVKCLAWAQCEGDSRSEQFLFAAGDDGLRIVGWDGCRSQAAEGAQLRADVQVGHAEELPGEDSSSAYDEQGSVPLAGEGGLSKASFREGEGFHAACDEAELEDLAEGLGLRFTRTSSGGIATTTISRPSHSFCRLITLGLKYQVAEEPIVPSPRHVEEHIGSEEYGILDILSSPGHRVVALVFGKQVAEKIHASRVFAGNDPFVVLAAVEPGGLKLSCCERRPEWRTMDPASPWVDFTLSRDILAGLTQEGQIFLWTAGSGKFLSSIDVTKQSVPPQIQGGSSNPSGIARNHEAKELVWSGFSKRHSWMEGAEGLSRTRVGQNRRHQDLDPFTERHESNAVHHFTRLALTPDSRMLAAGDVLGVVFIVSLDEGLSVVLPGASQRLAVSDIPCGTHTMATWGVAGIDIGRCTTTKYHQWLHDPDNAKNAAIDAVSLQNESSKRGDYLNDISAREVRRRRREVVLCSYRSIQDLKEMVLTPYDVVVALSSTGCMEIVCIELDLSNGVMDDINLAHPSASAMLHCRGKKKKRCSSTVLPFSFCGSLYFVTPIGLHVVLPSLALRSGESILTRPHVTGQWWPTGAKFEDLLDHDTCVKQENIPGALQKWQAEVLDRALIYDKLTETEQLCVQNGWNLSLLRLRRLELGLSFIQIDEVEQALETLMHDSVSKPGVLHTLFAAVELMINGLQGDKELARSSRFLAMAASFATSLIQQQGWLGLHQRNRKQNSVKIALPEDQLVSSELSELAGFLELIRGLQDRVDSRVTDSDQGHSKGAVVVTDEVPVSKATTVVGGERKLEILSHSPTGGISSDGVGLSVPALSSAVHQQLGGHASTSGILELDSGMGQCGDEVPLLPDGIREDLRIVAVENSGDMVSRWERDKLDAAGVVKDALQSGRVPLALVQLQALYAKEDVQPETEDLFQELQEIGRGIVYQWMCEGKTESAIAALSALGEDVEVSLHELALGTTRRDLRRIASAELQKHGWLGADERELLDKVHHLEGVYPGSSFWSAYNTRRKYLASIGKVVESNDIDRPQLSVDGEVIECGEVDGVVIGSWNVSGNAQDSPGASVIQDNPFAGYFSAAAIWLYPWDKVTFDRVLLDQPGIIGYSTPWETKVDYHIARHNWSEVSSLLDEIPSAALHLGQLYVSSNLNFESVEVVIPDVQILSISSDWLLTIWMRQMLEDKLLRKGIFFQTRWKGTTEVVALLARGDRLFSHCGETGTADESSSTSSSPRPLKEVDLNESTVKAVQQLMVLHCVENSLPHTLSLHVDQAALNSDKEFASRMLAIADGCHWASWLLLSYMEGCEYDASVENAKFMVASGSSDFKCTRVEDVEHTFRSFDHLCEVAGEKLAYANLVYTPVPLKTYMWSGLSTNSFSLSPSPSRKRVTEFPTLWKHLVACSSDSPVADLSLDAGERATNLAEYLSWRKGLFSCARNDLSILGMMPQWTPKSVRRLVQLSTEPDGEGLLKLEDSVDSLQELEEGPEKWEALIQASIERELNVGHPEDSEPKVVFFLRRGRGVAAFQYLLDSRLKNDHYQKLDPSAVLSALTISERKVVSLAVVLAVREYANVRVVTACICFLELCGVPASMVRIVVLSLRRISEFLEKAYNTEQLSQELLEAGFTSAVSHMLTLVEDYVSEVMNTDNLQLLVGKAGTHRYRKASIAISELLEKAILHDYSRSKVSYPQQEDERTAGSGRSFSEQWATVTAFCHAHQIPLSYAYLRALARDNDWVDFLSEAQIQACPLEKLIPIVAADFNDTRLRSHILIVLKSLPSTLPSAADSFITEETGSQEELFTLVAACEKSGKPSLALLQKARVLKWPLLPVVASCYDDVDPLLCFDVWLGVIAPVEESGLPDVPASCEAHAGEKDECLSDWMKRAMKRQKTISAYATPETQESTERGGDIGQDIQYSAAVDKLPMNELLVDHESLAKKVASFCERQEFFPLLKGFELFSPSSSLLPFIRFLQAFSQMRLAEASAHLSSFSTRLKEELQKSRSSSTWITGAAISAADAMLDACPSPYERHRLLQPLSTVDFGDGGPAAIRFRRLYWKMQLAEPALQDRNQSLAGGTSLEDDELLMALAKEGRWEDARSWARQLDLKDGQPSTGAALHHVTDTQAEAMVTDWKELLWDFPEERAALWGHCHALFTKYCFPPQRAGLFFLKHANDLDSKIPSSELHQLVLFAYQWLSDPQGNFPSDFLGELETRVWMLAVEAESEKSAGVVREMNEVVPSNGTQRISDHFEKSQDVISKANLQARRPPFSTTGNTPEVKGAPEVHSKGKQRRIPGHNMGRRAHLDDKALNASDESRSSKAKVTERDIAGLYLFSGTQLDEAFGGWKAQVDATSAKKAMLDLLEAGHLSAAKQLQQSLSIGQSPIELGLVEAAWNIALADKPLIANLLSTNVVEHLYSGGLVEDVASLSKPDTLEALTAACRQGCGQGFCRRIGAVSHIANVLGLPFSEAFEMESSQLLQLLALRGQDALAEAELLVTTHLMEAPSIAQILAESFLKGLVAAHRGGYLNGSQKEEGPAPLLWRTSDFTKWAKLCPSEPEVGHALMRLVSSEQAIPLACEVELLILTHHFYEASDCLDGMVILVALASERVKIYVAEGAFICLARLLTGIADFRRWRFILDLLIEHGQLNLLLRTYSEAGLESSSGTPGFCLALLSALKHFNPHDLDALEQVYIHFSMKHDLANLKQARARKGLEVWVAQNDLERSEDLLEVMRLFAEAGQLYAAVEAGIKAKKCCAQASLISLQLLMPEHLWLNLSDTNARRLMVEQPRFQEALIVAEAYGLNQPAEWVPVIWNHMLLYPARFDHFLSDFVATLPLPKDTLLELTRFYRAELAARGDQIDFSKWITPADVQLKTSLAKSFRLLLNRVPDIRLRIQLAIMATGFSDVVDTCSRLLDKVPENAGPLLLKRGHGGAYLPIM